MNPSRISEQQIIKILNVDELSRQHGFSRATFYRMRQSKRINGRSFHVDGQFLHCAYEAADEALLHNAASRTKDAL